MRSQSERILFYQMNVCIRFLLLTSIYILNEILKLHTLKLTILAFIAILILV